jgi:hypothetical protein
LVLRGFEPSRPVNSSSWGDAEILSKQVPAYVESVLGSQHASENGFDQRDAAYMVATLEQLIFDSESSLLERVYQELGKKMPEDLGREELERVLQDYLVHWMMGDDAEGIRLLLGNRTLLHEIFPNWELLQHFAHGQVEQLQYQRQQAPLVAGAQQGRTAGNALSPHFSFDEAHAVVGGITKSFAAFWESECTTMKAALVAMDTQRTGRVPLSKFYGSALDSEWRFGESEAYLRELGVLDESSWGGKHVIIPNYMQAASNCIVSAPHYLVCCQNGCDAVLQEIEAVVGAPVVHPQHLLSLVGNMTSMTDLDDEVPVQLGGSLTKQLEAIAEAHGGSVPIHGRLFAQWLHYAFPRECPFPHKTGTAAALTPSEFGGDYIASKGEMQAHATSNTSNSSASLGLAEEDLQWMSQWSEEEELIADYAGLLAPAWWANSRSVATAGGFSLLLLSGLFGAVKVNRKAGKADFLLPTVHKSHLQ